jgi:hypothetical protein
MAIINNVTMKEKVKEVLTQTFAYNVENDSVSIELCNLFDVRIRESVDELKSNLQKTKEDTKMSFENTSEWSRKMISLEGKIEILEFVLINES